MGTVLRKLNPGKSTSYCLFALADSGLPRLSGKTAVLVRQARGAWTVVPPIPCKEGPISEPRVWNPHESTCGDRGILLSGRAGSLGLTATDPRKGPWCVSFSLNKRRLSSALS